MQRSIGMGRVSTRNLYQLWQETQKLTTIKSRKSVPKPIKDKPWWWWFSKPIIPFWIKGRRCKVSETQCWGSVMCQSHLLGTDHRKYYLGPSTCTGMSIICWSLQGNAGGEARKHKTWQDQSKLLQLCWSYSDAVPTLPEISSLERILSQWNSHFQA